MYIDGFRIAAKLGKPDTAKSYISNWLTKHPDDEQLSKIYDKLDEVLKEEFGINPGKKASKGGKDN